MPNAKRITDLTQYQAILPYDSELFGVYQPLIGWRSKRKVDRIKFGRMLENDTLLSRLRVYFENRATINFNADCAVSSQDLAPASFAGPSLIRQNSIVLQQVSDRLRVFGEMPHTPDEWQHLVPADLLTQVLKTQVLDHYNQVSIDGCRRISQLQRGHETSEEFHNRQVALREQTQEEVMNAIANEAVIAGVIKELNDNGRISVLKSVFYSKFNQDISQAFLAALVSIDDDFTDPYLTFDPKKDVKDVTLSPLGIVHLYRQYFFELDTFLSTPTGHFGLALARRSS